MGTKIVKLSFRGSVHFGERRLSDSEYVCDAGTLFSALFVESLRMGAADEFVEAVRHGNCCISDAFPYIGERLYIPKPMIAVRGDKEGPADATSKVRKASKKLKYIPVDSLGDYLSGSLDVVAESDCFHLGKSFVRTKVNLERSGSEDAEPYHVGGFSFDPGCGIYFIWQGEYDLAPTLEQLSFAGIGGKRTSGYGSFDFEVIDAGAFPLSDGDSGDSRAMLLSSASPCEEELTDALLLGAQYRLVRKGGFVQSATHAATPRKKRDLWVFCPGSVFERRFEGDVFDVNDTPAGHSVYRYARAMWMEV